jgi:hypothetical protein
MKIAWNTLVFVCSLLFMFGVDLVVGILPGVFVVKDAQAIVGMPATPGSVAGVARRTTRRVVATEAAVVTTTAVAASASKPAAPPPTTVVVVTSPPASSAVPIGTVVLALPSGCVSVVVSGVNYSDCGGVFYRPAMQGNNLVYLVVEKPLK